MMIRKLSTGLGMLWLAAAANAQDGPPGTDIYVASINGNSLSAASNITQRPGYDNQPTFSADGLTIYFTRFADGQTDIARIDTDGSNFSILAASPSTSEYSATRRPGTNQITVVRVEEDGAQRVWAVASTTGARNAEEQLIEPDLAPVGYFDWFDHDRFAAFVLGEPHTLRTKHLRETDRIVAEDIGRTVRRLPDGRIGFVDKDGEDWVIRAVGDDGAVATLAPVVGQSEDFAVAPSGHLYMSSGATIHCWTDGAWVAVADYAEAGISNISRLNVSPDGSLIAFVADDPG